MAKKLKLNKTKKRLNWNLFVNDSIIDERVISLSHIEIIGNKKIEI